MKWCVSRKAFPPLLAAGLVLCVPVYGQPAVSSKPKVQTVLRDIDFNGAPATVKALNAGDGSAWKAVVRQVETGSPAWLDVARNLLAGTDAGRTSDLYFALAIALTKNAPAVLSILGPEVPVDKVCSVPYIEPDAKTVEMHRSKVRAALRKVSSPKLEAGKKACLEGIGK